MRIMEEIMRRLLTYFIPVIAVLKVKSEKN